MKSRFATYIAAITVLAALAIPVGLGAQDNRDHNHKHHHYKLIDIGTFGGPASFFNPTFNSVPVLNNRGLAVGDSATSTPTPPNGGCFFCGGIVGLVPFVFHAFELRKAVVTDLRGTSPVFRSANNGVASRTDRLGDTGVRGHRGCYRPADTLPH